MAHYILSPTAEQAAKLLNEVAYPDMDYQSLETVRKAFQEILDIAPMNLVTYFILKFPVDKPKSVRTWNGKLITHNILQIIHFANLTPEQETNLKTLFHYPPMGFESYDTNVAKWLCFGECDQQVTFHGVETTILTISENY